MRYKEKLAAIQWITDSKMFNEHQLIQLGDAIAAFHDCIEDLEVAEKVLVHYSCMHTKGEAVEYFNRKEMRKTKNDNS